ncbi:uncharacterized protein G2W53_024963 [Senna tora]|uniref:Uncharacterized protein n=1 Tax=Senna tora TaxID=362788 RepID=A0A834TC72_9FABA|nr:uncharacterized protein G2W53_024963 [Senna tora]
MGVTLCHGGVAEELRDSTSSHH